MKNLEARNVDLESAAIDTAETLKRSAKEEVNTLSSRVNELETALAESNSSLEKARAQCHLLEKEVTAKSSHAEEMEAKMNRMRIDLDSFDDREASLKDTISELEAELAAQQSVVDAAATREQEAAREVEAAQQEKEETRALVVKSAKCLRERIAAVRQAGSV